MSCYDEQCHEHCVVVANLAIIICTVQNFEVGDVECRYKFFQSRSAQVHRSQCCNIRHRQKCEMNFITLRSRIAKSMLLGTIPEQSIPVSVIFPCLVFQKAFFPILSNSRSSKIYTRQNQSRTLSIATCMQSGRQLQTEDKAHMVSILDSHGACRSKIHYANVLRTLTCINRIQT